MWSCVKITDHLNTQIWTPAAMSSLKIGSIDFGESVQLPRTISLYMKKIRTPKFIFMEKYMHLHQDSMYKNYHLIVMKETIYINSNVNVILHKNWTQITKGDGGFEHESYRTQAFSFSHSAKTWLVLLVPCNDTSCNKCQC